MSAGNPEVSDGQAFLPRKAREARGELCKAPRAKREGAGGATGPRAKLVCQAANWFIVLSLPAAFSAASPAKYSLWSSPMSLPDIFWCFTQAMP
ncbi:hypothetical protein SKP52_07395 [Sphingopyxis fribergensis]|uniref:Uncharacterized protein n=1 Tax=Sphingopyxis fribergensis TaxID=1515612 RepID=A0A0A7PEF3_9SPHN|nr:hypothetical protein SKP52_07395 [Sphingopyxis fribergensis]